MELNDRPTAFFVITAGCSEPIQACTAGLETLPDQGSLLLRVAGAVSLTGQSRQSRPSGRVVIRARVGALWKTWASRNALRI
ncbi:hypothetical protein ACIA8E_32450 [Streptomyces sp. NPDC051664]|uniref:hypothetical protein n=1 Tax=Streptomyces sp. NPDC051664 TaxID=3365668 RepID=UPI003796BDB5